MSVVTRVLRGDMTDNIEKIYSGKALTAVPANYFILTVRKKF